MNYPARKRKKMLGGGRRGSGFLSVCFFFSQNIKLHTHTTCPLHHTILSLFQGGGGGGGGVGEVGGLLNCYIARNTLFAASEFASLKIYHLYSYALVNKDDLK